MPNQKELREKSITENLEAEFIRGLEQEHKKLCPRLSEKEWLKIFPEARPYLASRLDELQIEYKKLRLEIKKNLLRIYKTDKDEFSIWLREKIWEVWLGERLDWLSKEIKKIKWALRREEQSGKADKITDNMIWRAQNYPFEQLIKFNQAKKAICIFHNDKHPSLSLNPRTNRIKCFVCGASFDTIGFVMETQKISFVEAIKYLNNY